MKNDTSSATQRPSLASVDLRIVNALDRIRLYENVERRLTISEEDALREARFDLSVLELAKRALSATLPKQATVWMPCARHQGASFRFAVGYSAPAIPICPQCEADKCEHEWVYNPNASGNRPFNSCSKCKSVRDA